MCFAIRSSTEIFLQIQLLSPMSLPMIAVLLIFLPCTKRIHLCVTCRACLDVRLNIYMTRNIGLRMEPTAIFLKHEFSNSSAPEIRRDR